MVRGIAVSRSTYKSEALCSMLRFQTAPVGGKVRRHEPWRASGALQRPCLDQADVATHWTYAIREFQPKVRYRAWRLVGHIHGRGLQTEMLAGHSSWAENSDHAEGNIVDACLRVGRQRGMLRILTQTRHFSLSLDDRCRSFEFA